MNSSTEVDRPSVGVVSPSAEVEPLSPSSRRPARVLIAADHICYPGNVLHGGTTYFLNTLPRIDPARVEGTMCFLAAAEPVAERLRATGVNAIYLGRRKWDPRAVADLVRLLRARDIDVIHVHGMKSILLGRLAAAWVGCRSVVHLHDNNRVSSPILQLQRWLMRWTDEVVGVSQETAGWATRYLQAPTARTSALHNGVDVRQVLDRARGQRETVRGMVGASKSALVIVVVGRFNPVKRHDRLIAMMPALRARCPNVELWCVGDGATRPACEARVASLGLTACVRFLGQRDDVPAVLDAADLLVVPSDHEALSFSAIEALAVGRPVVAFACGGITEVVRDRQTGFLVPAGDDASFIRALGDLLTNHDLRLRFGEAAARDVLRFDIHTSVDRLQQLYFRVKGSPAQPRWFPKARRVRATVRKNLPELMGLLNRGMPSFIWRAAPGPLGTGVPVFCYHRAEPASFAADLEFLVANGYTTLDGEALEQHLVGTRPAPPKSVVITFDDGAISLHDVAFPVLQRFQQRAIAFICPGLHAGTTEGGLCAWTQIELMHGSGLVDFQSHTVEHRLVSAWPQAVPLFDVDPAVSDERRGSPLPLEDDLRRSREMIERRLGKSVLHLAFPMYRGSAAAVRAARAAGYKAMHWGVRAGAGLNHPGRPPEQIGRISGEFLRRLPGEGRRPLSDILRARMRTRGVV